MFPAILLTKEIYLNHRIICIDVDYLDDEIPSDLKNILDEIINKIDDEKILFNKNISEKFL